MVSRAWRWEWLYSAMGKAVAVAAAWAMGGNGGDAWEGLGGGVMAGKGCRLAWTMRTGGWDSSGQ